MQILLVEDDPVSQKIVDQTLGKWGYNVSCANDGVEALGRVSDTAFDLILMDLNMPILDGIETTKAMRARSGTYLETVPIVALTACFLPDTKTKSLACGMNDLIHKPINPPELHCKIGQHLLAMRVDARPMQIRFDIFANANPDFKFELVSLMIKNLREIQLASYKVFYSNDVQSFSRAAHKVKSTLMLLDDQELTFMINDLNASFERTPNHDTNRQKILRFNLLVESIVKTLAADISAYAEPQSK